MDGITCPKCGARVPDFTAYAFHSCTAPRVAKIQRHHAAEGHYMEAPLAAKVAIFADILAEGEARKSGQAGQTER